jgi:hypothetical protein
LREEDVLAHTSIVLLASKKAVEDYNWVAFRFALIIVQAVRKIDSFAVRGRVEGARPWYRRGCVRRWYPCGMLGMDERRVYGPQAAVYRAHWC